MKTFFQWVEDLNLKLPVLADAEEGEEADTSENRARTGLRGVYPSAYYRSQYPDNYSMPKSATAALDLKNAKGQKDRAG